LTVFDLLGREVSTLVNGMLEPGPYTVRFPAANEHASNIGSGIYIYRLTAGGFTAVKKMTLIR
jgi:hypothetical protein